MVLFSECQQRGSCKEKEFIHYVNTASHTLTLNYAKVDDGWSSCLATVAQSHNRDPPLSFAPETMLQLFMGAVFDTKAVDTTARNIIW